uniref:Uncharacterized protein n=1 Tax=Haptolina brevifila TaxID=156173 RepID=A0A7S2N866_9EUKA
MLTPADLLQPSYLVGLQVVPHGLLERGSGMRQMGTARVPTAAPMVYDGVMRVISFTSVHAGLHSLLAEGAAMPLVISKLTAWLERDQRLVESATGLPLRRAYFVRVNIDTGCVTEVLCSPQLLGDVPVAAHLNGAYMC